MAVFVRRTKCMKVQFNEKVRERIFGFLSNQATASSGSDHPAAAACTDDVVSLSSPFTSCSLSILVRNFLECEAAGAPEPPPWTDSDSEDDESARPDPMDVIQDIVINPTVKANVDGFRGDLLAHVMRAAETFSLVKTKRMILNRNVMAYLREIGYDAGICKTKWTAASGVGLAAGNYEFIDVLIWSGRSGDRQVIRYFVDADFGAEFEIARETECYEKLRSALPRVFVGSAEDLKRILRVVCDEVRRSMKCVGLALPPWRKHRYMMAKWFGPYRRTVNLQVPSGSDDRPVVDPVITVQCRSVGFDCAVDGGPLYVPPATRTR
ncbi:hypothetical protein Dimus_016974 [Dionaea muscipula]